MATRAVAFFVAFLLAHPAAQGWPQEGKSPFPALDREGRALLEEAERLRVRGRRDAALKHLRAATRRHPHPQLFFALGVAAWEAGELEEAARAFRSALEAAPEADIVRRNLGRVLLRLGRSREAAAILAEALRRSAGEDPELARLLAQAYLDAGDLQAARSVLARVLGTAPGDRDLRVAWVLTWVRTGPPTVAAREAEAALARFPGDPRLVRLLATALIAAGRYEEAADAMAALARLGGARPEDYRTLGDLYLRLGLAREAVASYRRALAGGSGDRETRRRLARALLRAGARREAARELAQLKREAPADPEVWLLLGEEEEALGRLEEARQAYAKARKLGGAGRAALALGRVAWRAGDLQGAEEAFRAAAAEKDTAPDGWVSLGRLYEHQGRRAEAARAYREALARDPDRREAYLGLLRVLGG